MPEANQAVEAFPLTIINPEKLPHLLSALASAQGEYLPLKRDKLVEQRLKDKTTGEYGNRTITFYYADMAAIIEATRPALSKHGLSFFQPLHDDGNSLWLVTCLAHSEGCMIQARAAVNAGSDMKVFGGLITYLRRYMGAPMLGVSAEDDLDEDGDGIDDGSGRAEHSSTASAAPRQAPQRKSAAQPADAKGANKVTDGQLKNLQLKIKTSGVNETAIANMLARLGVPAIDANMTGEHWALVKKEVEKVVA